MRASSARAAAALLVAGVFSQGGLAASTPVAGDAALAAGSPLASMMVRWKPTRQVSPLPSWAPSPVEVLDGAARFTLPARWQQPSVDRFVLTVVFVDTEDSGPVIEWQSPAGVVTRLSDGLGEGAESLGLHARTMVLPDAMTRDGGTVSVAMPWRIEGLVSASLRPARDVTVAVPGASNQPGLVERSGTSIETEDLEGREVAPVTGDLREGPIVEAELSAGIENLDGELEFRIPVDGTVDGAVLFSELLGLDPSARVDVAVNGRRAGELNSAAFRLDDPAVHLGSDGMLTIAGWRKHSLFLPAWLWRQGENAIVLAWRPPSGPAARSVFPVSLKNTRLHLRFGAAEPRDVPPPWPVDLAVPAEPDFTTPVGVVEDLPPLPLVMTAPPPTPAPTPPPLPHVAVQPPGPRPTP